MTRVFTSEQLAEQQTVTLDHELAHYLLDVMRLAVGDHFVMIDASSQEYDVVIEECSRGKAIARVAGRLEPAPEPTFRLDLYQAVLKGKRFELVIQKCTELGAGRIVPIFTQRAIARPRRERAEARLARWRKLALEACRQCGRTQVPDVEAPMGWDDALRDWEAGEIPGLLPYEGLAAEAEHGLRQTLADLKQTQRLAVFIGPEGGFAPMEFEQGRAAGLVPVSLGPRILRAETAAIAVCAIVMYELDSG